MQRSRDSCCGRVSFHSPRAHTQLAERRRQNTADLSAQPKPVGSPCSLSALRNLSADPRTIEECDHDSEKPFVVSSLHILDTLSLGLVATVSICWSLLKLLLSL